MTLTLTAAQEAALAKESQLPVVCVKIDLTTDLLYCSGGRSVTIAGDTYTPRSLEMNTFTVGDPQSSTASVTLDDLDGALADAWYTERFSAATITVTEAIYSDGAWVAVRTVPWMCTTCSRGPDGKFTINLSGAGGMRPKKGLELASRADFHLAPEEGASVRVGGYITRLVG